MLQWTEKIQPQQDWITILIVLVFALSAYLYRKNTHQFKLLLSFWQFKSYFNIYGKEKYANPLHFFNLILLLISVINFYVIAYFFCQKNLMLLLERVSFLSFFTFISVIVIGRYWILKFICQVYGQLEIFQQAVFKSMSFYAVASLFGIFFFMFYHYHFSNKPNLLLILSIVVICFVFVSHLTIYLNIIGMKPNFIVYLILYLCAFKIAPWLWLYKSIY